MAKTWTYKYNGNTIEVKNSVCRGEELVVNGSLQDKTYAIFSARLWGRLQSGEEIKVTLGGTWSVKCYLFVDNILQNIVPK